MFSLVRLGRLGIQFIHPSNFSILKNLLFEAGLDMRFASDESISHSQRVFAFLERVMDLN